MTSLTGAIWDIRSRAPRAVFEELADLPSLAVQLLHNRGYHVPEDIRGFLDGPLPPHDPYLLSGMECAVARIMQALEVGERVHVYGDYDVDGVTGTALLVEALEMLGVRATPYIPERLAEGYGLNLHAIDTIGADGPGLVITTDCGTGSAEEIAQARQHGLDVIVTDHHIGDGSNSGAVAMLNPNQAGNEYPFTGLAGVGVAYKLVQALAEEMPDRLPYPEDFLDLVALGTIADMAPLRDENRAFVTDGLVALRQSQRLGLVALGEVSRRPIASIDAADISFSYGPRLNAAGRLAHAKLALQLLQSRDALEAETIARKLDDLNVERRRLTEIVVAQVAEQIDRSLPFVLAVGEDFPAGVIGLAASQIVRTTGLPAFVATLVNGTLRGSARSPDGVSLSDILETQSDVLVSWGGHARAAGFALRPECLEDLRLGLGRELGQPEIEAQLGLRMEADCRVFPRTVTWETHELTQALGPFGQSHREPCFVVENVAIEEARLVGSDHLALRFAELGSEVDAIWFGQAGLRGQLPAGRRCDAAFRLNLRSFGGETRLQMLIDDMRHTVAV